MVFDYWHNRIVVVRHSQCDYAKQLVSPKSNRERYIPLDIELYEMLLSRKRDTGYVFLDADGQPFNSYRLSNRLAKLRKKVGLKEIGWHTLRHTLASQL